MFHWSENKVQIKHVGFNISYYFLNNSELKVSINTKDYSLMWWKGKKKKELIFAHLIFGFINNFYCLFIDFFDSTSTFTASYFNCNNNKFINNEITSASNWQCANSRLYNSLQTWIWRLGNCANKFNGSEIYFGKFVVWIEISNLRHSVQWVNKKKTVNNYFFNL